MTREPGQPIPHPAVSDPLARLRLLGAIESLDDERQVRNQINRRRERMGKVKRRVIQQQATIEVRAAAKWLLGEYQVLYKDRIGAAYAPHGGDLQHLCRLLREYTVVELGAYLDYFVSLYAPVGEPKAYLAGWGHGVRSFLHLRDVVIREAQQDARFEIGLANWEQAWEEHSG